MINHDHQQNLGNKDEEFIMKSLPQDLLLLNKLCSQKINEQEITNNNLQQDCRNPQDYNQNYQCDFSKEQIEIFNDNLETGENFNSLKIKNKMIKIDGVIKFINLYQNRTYTLKSESFNALRQNYQSSQVQSSNHFKQEEQETNQFYNTVDYDLSESNQELSNHEQENNKELTNNICSLIGIQPLNQNEIAAPQYVNGDSFFNEYILKTINIHFVLFFDRLLMIKRIAIRMADVAFDDAMQLLNIYMTNDECCCYYSEKKKIPKKLNFNVLANQKLANIYNIVCPDQAQSLFINYHIINFQLDNIESKLALDKMFKNIQIFEKYLDEIKQIHQVTEKLKFDELEKQFIQEIQAI